MEEREFETILFSREDQRARITLNRPEIHNAFNSRMISEIDRVLDLVREDKSVRVLIITGKGKSFCAGADIHWLRDIINYTYEENYRESLHLAEILHKLYSLPKPSVAAVNGPAIGGGNGLLSACDIVIASEGAIFGLSEVKIGLVPAAISPYVLKRIGEGNAREYFLTGKRITAEKAFEIGLVNRVVPHEKLEDEVDEIVKQLLSSGPEAMASCKELIFNVLRMDLEEAKEYTARVIANLRVSEEGQEGMSSFLEKRKPRWVKGKSKEKKKGKAAKKR
ncbi:MAG: enoyl-CoA hydratase/isomerase family protein [Candidatus Aminicenantales bacterium]